MGSRGTLFCLCGERESKHIGASIVSRCLASDQAHLGVSLSFFGEVDASSGEAARLHSLEPRWRSDTECDDVPRPPRKIMRS